MSFDPAALVRIIESSGVPHRQNAIAFIFACPRCQKKDKLYIRKRDGRFICWVCAETENFKGHAEWALRELTGLRIRELQEKLYGGEIPDQMSVEFEIEFEDKWGEVEDDEISIPPAPKAVCYPFDFVEYTDPLFVEGARYLASRGINIDHVKTYDIRYCPAYVQGMGFRTDRRIIFPVKVNDTLIGWQARIIDQTKRVDEETGRVFNIPKILTSESLRDSGARYLMFQDRLRGSSHCVLAEGPVSAIKAHLCGGNVASMGKAVSAAQLETILSYGVKKLYLALDPDAAADVSRILRDLDPSVETYLLLPPDGREDLGAATQDEVYEQFMKAPRVDRDVLMFSLGSTFAC
jgi:hypothetical protein